VTAGRWILRLAFFPSDLDGPAFYRCLFPAAILSQNGHKCVMPKMTIIPGTHIYAMPVNTAELGELDADLFVLQQRREAQWIDGVQDLHDQCKLVIAETDDADLHMPKWHPGAKGWSRTKSPMANRHWQFLIYRAADAMTVATPALAEMYARFNPNIHIIRNYLNWEMWKNVTPVYEREFRKIRVGWMGSYDLRQGDLKQLSWLGKWLERNPNVEFVAASGDSRVHDILNVPQGQRVTTNKVNFRDMDLADITATFDIGLIPLDRIPFNEAKSHLKGMEYAACGIPCIATPTESYRHWVEEGVNGFLAKSEKDWVQRLDELVADSELRTRMGVAARAKAEDNTIQAHWAEWERTYEQILGRSRDESRRSHADVAGSVVAA